MQIIFVGGIHGSGKTTFCRSFAPALQASHESAGELIRTEAGRVETSDKTVVDVDSNQALLLRALQRLSTDTSRLVLDGHYTLVTGNGDFARVPIEVFRTINPRALLHLSADPSATASRLATRDQRTYSETFIAEHNRAERQAAEFVSSALDCPLFLLDAEADGTTVLNLQTAIASILETPNENPS